MDPDDHFSPPLDGLSRGKKLHQILTTFKSSDIVVGARDAEAEGDSDIYGIVSIQDIVENPPSDRAGLLMANWWHMPLEEDWWEYRYFEIDPEEFLEAAESLEEDLGDAGDESREYTVQVPTEYHIEWLCQENEHVDGLQYIKEAEGSGEKPTYREFNPGFNSPKPLTRAILDTYLVENIRERHSK